MFVFLFHWRDLLCGLPPSRRALRLSCPHCRPASRSFARRCLVCCSIFALVSSAVCAFVAWFLPLSLFVSARSSLLVLCSLCLLSLGYLSNVALYHRFQADACSVFRSMVSPIHIDLGQHTRPPSPSPFLALSLCCLVFFLLNSFFSFQRCDFSESFYFCLLIFNV